MISQEEMVPPQGRELLLVQDVRRAMADVVVGLNREVLEETTLIGVTGTNGKTSTTHMIQSILNSAGKTCAAIGTTGVKRADGELLELSNTTPDILELMNILKSLSREGTHHFVLEVSSQGVVQRRVANLPFRVAVFTNITPEHMECHGDFQTYLEAKLSFFKEAVPAALEMGRPFLGIVYGESPQAKDFIDACPGPPFLFGFAPHCDIRASELSMNAQGTAFTLNSPRGRLALRLGLPGKHNVLNALAAVGVAISMGISDRSISNGLENLTEVPGRLQRVPRSRMVFIDYAHTSDALENLLLSCLEMKETDSENLILVFGCGGDRDESKRARMGGIAARLCNRCYITSDNPRSEDPMSIIEGILSGIEEEPKASIEVVLDRAEGIERALRESSPRDLIVIAGKGHENYQILGDKVVEFDDLLCAQELLKELDEENNP